MINDPFQSNNNNILYITCGYYGHSKKKLYEWMKETKSDRNTEGKKMRELDKQREKWAKCVCLAFKKKCVKSTSIPNLTYYS